MEIQKITLQAGREKSLERKHPWIFSGAIRNLPKGIRNGDVVEVVAKDGSYQATGHYSDGSIAIRILTFDQQPIDANFWQSTIANAANYRKKHLDFPSEHTNAYRLIHGEGDGLPGLVVDIYGEVAVVQCHSLGMHRSINEIAKAIIDVFGGTIKAVYDKSEEALKQGDKKDSWLIGQIADEIDILENGNKFTINFVSGQKTGFFLDQRDNRSFVGHHSPDQSVLNCFSYTGGFSVYALNAGAKDVVSVDVSKTATDLMDKNMALTKHAAKHLSVTANVMEYLKSEEVPMYDIVIIDPPAFAKSINKRHNAVQAYKRLNALALTKVKTGGLLFTFSCSQVVGTQLFYDTIVAAAIEAGRKIRVMRHLSQGADHPVNLFHPEGHYLKGLMLEVS
ncbi:MAG: class I SAM-dependent rRNA methyltransferase [Saprospiraceae bacterium]|nr:class I SAM-dependent rRNA methyltransferase [Saprospiraceae bacterium]